MNYTLDQLIDQHCLDFANMPAGTKFNHDGTPYVLIGYGITLSMLNLSDLRIVYTKDDLEDSHDTDFTHTPTL